VVGIFFSKSLQIDVVFAWVNISVQDLLPFVYLVAVERDVAE
jgi:hypothetical protein